MGKEAKFRVWEPYKIFSAQQAIEGIYQRAEIGRIRKDNYVHTHNAQIRQDIAATRKSTFYKGRGSRAARRDFIERLETDLLPEGTPYVIDLQDRISPEDKQKVYGTSILAMRRLVQPYSITIPEDALSRMLIVNEETFKNVALQETGDGEGIKYAAGICLPNGLALVNFEASVELAEENDINSNDILRENGVHELWHRFAYDQQWLPINTPPENFRPAQLMRRGGFMTRRPGNAARDLEAVSGLNILTEGFTQLLTHKTLILAGEKYPELQDPDDGYRQEEAIIKLLTGRIRMPVFMDAYLKKHGLRKLHASMEGRYGTAGLRRLARLVHEGRWANEVARGWFLDAAPYEEVIQFIRRRRPQLQKLNK